ncbi:hypothetical protein D9M71_569430 [compost metagenome]
MVGEVAIDLTEQRNDFAAQCFDQLRSDDAGGTVAAVDHDLEFFRQLDVVADLREVTLKDLDLGDTACAGAQVIGLEAGVQGLDLFIG